MSKHLLMSLVLIAAPFANADECRGDLACLPGGGSLDGGRPPANLPELPETRPSLGQGDNNAPLEILPPAQRVSLPAPQPPAPIPSAPQTPKRPPSAPRSFSAECIQKMTAAGYSLEADFIAACRGTRSSFAVSAVGAVAGTRQDIALDTLKALTRIETAFGLTCVQNFTGNGYTMTADFVRACGQVASVYASKAITSVTSLAQDINLDAFEQLVAINRREALQVVQTLTNAGYSLGASTDILRAIRRFHGPAGVKALKNLAATGQDLSVQTIEQLAALD